MNIIYKESNKEPKIGLLDMLLVIGEITRRHDIHIEVSKFIVELEKEKKITDNFCERLKEYVEKTFKSLSIHEELEIIYLNSNEEIRSDKKPDLFSDIIVELSSTHKMHTSTSTVFIPLNNRSLANKLVWRPCIDLHNDLFEIIPHKIKEKKNFICCLIIDYVDKNVLDILEVR